MGKKSKFNSVKLEGGKIVKVSSEINYVEYYTERDEFEGILQEKQVRLTNAQSKIAALQQDVDDYQTEVTEHDAILAAYETANPDDPDVIARLNPPEPEE